MRAIRNTSILGACLAVLLSVSGPAKAADYPNVASLKPFTAEANYMSLPGYLRYQHYAMTGEWLSRGEAVAIVQQGLGAASR